MLCASHNIEQSLDLHRPPRGGGFGILRVVGVHRRTYGVVGKVFVTDVSDEVLYRSGGLLVFIGYLYVTRNRTNHTA